MAKFKRRSKAQWLTLIELQRQSGQSVRFGLTSTPLFLKPTYTATSNTWSSLRIGS